MGVADEGDTAVGGDDEPDPTATQVIPLLVRVPSLSNRSLVVAGVDPRGEVGHVEHETGQIGCERLDYLGLDAALDLFQVVCGDG